MPSSRLPDPDIANALKTCVGNELRKKYSGVPSEPIPTQLAGLVRRLEGQSSLQNASQLAFEFYKMPRGWRSRPVRSKTRYGARC
jgi:hypothetical protein